MRLRLAIGLFTCGFFAWPSAGRAGDLRPDIGGELAQARKAWAEGDALGAQFGAATSEKFDALLRDQEHAYQRANQAFRDALKKDPGNPHGLAEYGRFWLSQKEYALARSRLEAAWSSGLSAAERSANLLVPPCGARAEQDLTAAEKGDILRALGGLAECAGETNSAIGFYKTAMRRDEANPRNRISLAVCLCASGKPSEAAALLAPWGASAEHASPDAPASPAARALGLYTLAVAKEEMGLIDDALNLHRTANALATQKATGESGNVAEFSAMAIERLEDFLDAVQMREKQRAALNQERAKKQLPPLPPLNERADLAEASYMCERGVSFKNSALSDPALLSALAKARNNEGEPGVLEKCEQYESFLAAIQSFQDAISRYPRLARAHYELALCNVLAGRFGAARPLLDAAALYSPNNLAILSLQGDVLLELGQWAEAAGAFKKLLALDPQSGRANYGLARAYLALQSNAGICQAGLTALDRAVQLGVHDSRIFKTQTLVLNSGQEYRGQIMEAGGEYIVLPESASSFRIARAEVKTVTEGPGMREQLVELVARFERGEKAPPRPVIRGRPKTTRGQQDAPEPWSGSLFGN